MLRPVVALLLLHGAMSASPASGAERPSPEAFDRMLSTCATESHLHVTADLLGSIGRIYRGNGANGHADIDTTTGFMAYFDKKDRPAMYELYTRCIAGFLHSEHQSTVEPGDEASAMLLNEGTVANLLAVSTSVTLTDSIPSSLGCALRGRVPVEVLGDTVELGGDTWVNVRVSSGHCRGRTGWVIETLMNY